MDPFAISKEFTDTLKKEKELMEIPRSSKFSETKTKIIVQNLSEKFGITTQQTLTVLSILFQQGGTSRKCDGNLTAKIFGKEIKLSELRAFLRAEGAKGGERKLARTLGTPIQRISACLELEGNLAKAIIKNNMDKQFTKDELSWMSDFQNENPDCPEEIRKLIHKHFSMKKQNPQSQPKQKDGGN
jgi:hypothetical protein